MIKGVCGKVCFIKGLIGPWIYPVDISSPWMHNWNRHLEQLEESQHWFSDPWSEEYYSRKSQVEATRTVYLWKYLSPGRTAVIGAPIKIWKIPEQWFLPPPHSTCLFSLWRRQSELEEWHWIIMHLIRQWFQLHLLFQMGFCCWSNQHTSWDLVYSYWSGHAFVSIPVSKNYQKRSVCRW